MKPHGLYSSEHASAFIRVFGSTPQLRIIDFFLDNPRFDFTRDEMMEALGMAKRTLARHLPALRDSGFVKVSRRIGRAELYRLNAASEFVVKLRELEDKITSYVDASIEEPLRVITA